MNTTNTLPRQFWQDLLDNTTPREARLFQQLLDSFQQPCDAELQRLIHLAYTTARDSAQYYREQLATLPQHTASPPTFTPMGFIKEATARTYAQSHHPHNAIQILRSEHPSSILNYWVASANVIVRPGEEVIYTGLGASA